MGRVGRIGRVGRVGVSRVDFGNAHRSKRHSRCNASRHVAATRNACCLETPRRLCVRVYRLTAQRFPREEKYGLSAQVRRAAYSVAANIVEGRADRSSRWRLRYLRIAVGSLAEVGYGLHLAGRLESLNVGELAELEKEVSAVAAPLHALVKSVRAAARCEKKDAG